MSGPHVVNETGCEDVENSRVQKGPDEVEIGFDADLSPNNRVDTLDSFVKPLVLDEAALYNLACRFSKVYQHLARTSQEQFLPTPVTRLPTGKETGRYLAIDVGGSNLRVAFIELLGETADSDGNSVADESRDTIRMAQRQRVRRTLEKAWPIQEHLKMDKAEDLFSWIGDCIAEVVADNLTSDATKGEIPTELEMGITFSFPIMYVYEFSYCGYQIVLMQLHGASMILDISFILLLAYLMLAPNSNRKQARVGHGGYTDANG
jgi:hexokinase